MKDKTAQLAKSATKGDATAFGELYSLFADEMYRYALYSLGSREAAKDAVQDTALEAFKNIIKLKNESAAKAWFFGILYNVCKRFQREKYRAEFTPLELCGELSSADTNEEVLSGLDLVRVPDGRLFLVSNPVSENWGERSPLTLCCSEDNGKSWQTVMTLEEEKIDSEFSYPAIEYLNGKLYIAYTHERLNVSFRVIEL